MFLTISLLILLFANLYYAGEKNVLLVFFLLEAGYSWLWNANGNAAWKCNNPNIIPAFRDGLAPPFRNGLDSYKVAAHCTQQTPEICPTEIHYAGKVINLPTIIRKMRRTFYT